MNLEQTVAALRATKLPTLRQRQLTLEAVHAASDDARALLVARARQEAIDADREHQEHVREEFRARWEWGLKNPPREPEPVVKHPKVDDRPKERQVQISWTTPKRPDIVRAERRPEMNEGRERSRAQRELAEIAQRAEPAQRPEPMWDDNEPSPTPTRRTYSTQPPVELPIDMTHGTVAYRDFKCRCSVCREAKRLSRSSRGIKAPRGTIPEHGTITRYVKLKCRDDCPGNPLTGKTCREVAADYARALNRKKKIVQRHK